MSILFERKQATAKQRIKKMLLVCITGGGRQEIVLLQPTGKRLAFDTYRMREFFNELLKKFSDEKEEEGRKLEYNSRRLS